MFATGVVTHGRFGGGEGGSVVVVVLGGGRGGKGAVVDEELGVVDVLVITDFELDFELDFDLIVVVVVEDVENLKLRNSSTSFCRSSAL